MKIWNIVLLSLFCTSAAYSQVLVPGSVKLVEGTRGTDNVPTYVLLINGTIASPMAKEVESQLALAKDPQRSLLLHLNSPGGSKNEGEAIIALIKKQKDAGRSILSVVENGEECASMCVPIYVMGDTRYAGEVSAFMFHGPIQFALTNVPDAWAAKEQVNFLKTRGVSGDWLQKLWDMGVYTTPGEYWMSGKELMDENSGVVTKSISRHKVEEAWTAPFDPNIRPR